MYWCTLPWPLTPGELVSLVFPLGEFEGGPPYALSPQIVSELLTPAGFEAGPSPTLLV